MPMQVNIKKKEPRFKGDKPTYYPVVSGSVDHMSRQIENYLALNGLSRMGDPEERSEFVVWSGRPQIGGPPAYLAAMFEEKFNMDLTKEARTHITRAFAEVPKEDGLEAFLGRGAGVSPGKTELVVRVTAEDFVVNCDADNLPRVAALEAARWLPIENPAETIKKALGTEPFRTRDPLIASYLERYMTDRAKQRLKEVFPSFYNGIKNATIETAPEGFDISAPEGLDYLPFQKHGIQTILNSGKSGIIADDMGLGKTVQGIGIINGRPDAVNILVICQANMKLKWQREINKWKINQDLDVGIAAGSTVPNSNVVVINYDICAKNEDTLRSRDWDLILTDEAHNMKNEESQRTQAILGELLEPDGKKSLPLAEGGQLVMLTGTPKPNRVSELWPILTTIAPEVFGRGPRARQIFLNRYQPPFLIKKEFQRGNRTFENIIPMNGKPVRMAELQMSMKGTGRFIRRLKSQMKDSGLPPKWRTPLDIPMRLTKEQKELLREAEADLSSILSSAEGKPVRVGVGEEAGSVIQAISRLDPDTPQFHEMARVRRNLGLIKAEACAKFILDELAVEKDFAPEERTKTVIFAHHKDVIDIISKAAKKRAQDIGIKPEKGPVIPGEVLIYDGSSGNDKKRQAIIDRFQEDDNVRAIIISLAGATGITLTAAARMRMVEFDWSPSNMIQIEDRIWRIGQEKNVDIGYMSIPGTLDARIGDALVEKMTVNTEAIDEITLHPKAIEKPKKKREEPTQDDFNDPKDQGSFAF